MSDTKRYAVVVNFESLEVYDVHHRTDDRELAIRVAQALNRTGRPGVFVLENGRRYPIIWGPSNAE